MENFKLHIIYTKIVNNENTTKHAYFASQADTKEEAITLSQSSIDDFISRVSGSLISIN